MNNNEDNPFYVEKIDIGFGDLNNLLLRGIPRIIVIIFILIVSIIIYWFFKKFNLNRTYLIKSFVKFILDRIGFKINISNKDIEKIKNSDANIIVCNHSSYLDSIFLTLYFPDAYFIASSFVKDIPLISSILKDKCLFLEKEFSGGGLTKKIEDMIKKENKKIIFFAEGCCKSSNSIIKFRKGAFTIGEKVLPIFIKYRKEYEWTRGMQNTKSHMIKIINNKENNVSIKIGNIYIPNEKDKNNADEFAENFRKYYANEFNVKLSDKSYKDHPYYSRNI
jgi:1-acyl-sn-glycerol-3-phosphate acyltransferase